MPYESQAQAAFFNANKEKLEAQGVDVTEWNRSSKGLELPEHKSDLKKRFSQASAARLGAWKSRKK